MLKSVFAFIGINKKNIFAFTNRVSFLIIR